MIGVFYENKHVSIDKLEKIVNLKSLIMFSNSLTVRSCRGKNHLIWR